MVYSWVLVMEHCRGGPREVEMLGDNNTVGHCNKLCGGSNIFKLA